MRFHGIFGKPNVERMFVREELRRVMAEFGEYQAHFFGPDASAAELLPVLREADVILTGWGTPGLPPALLAERPVRLKYVCNLTGAVRHCLPREYIEAGVLVTNWGDGPMWYLAEGNLTLMLALLREVPRVHRHMVERPQWMYPYRAPSATLRYKTVGFVGMGAIGRMLVDLLKPFDCSILAYDPYAAELPAGVDRCARIEELFDRADIITVQCGLTPETTGLIGRDLLRRLKPHALFINTARGKVVREQELIEVLRERPDLSAGLDVYEHEPLPVDSPLLQLDNAICYPHSCGTVGEAMYQTACEYAAGNLRAFCTGAPMKGLITAEKYDRMT